MILVLAASALPAASLTAQVPSPELTPFASHTVGAEELSQITGRADTAQQIRAQNSSTVANNTVSGQSETGQINFDAGSFQALAGLSLLSANTGNNVSINSSLNVNVSISPR
jgi:hypothetical protein